MVTDRRPASRKPGRWRRSVAALAVLAGLVSFACEGPDVDPNATPDAEATVAHTPTPTPTPSPTATPAVQPKEPELQRHAYVPAGPIAAEPVRVHTGDGDCLNVRPSPGLTFQSDPRTCVPEGFLLWLYGPALDVDGLRWRYALGEGWVAEQYVQPDQAASSLFDGEIPPVVVSTTDGVDVYLSRIEGGSTVTSLGSVGLSPQAGAWRPPEISPDGRWVAGVSWNSWPVTRLFDLATGADHEHPGTAFVGWSAQGMGLLVTFPNCPNNCNGERLAYVTPGQPAVEFATVPSGSWGYQWSPGGDSVIARAEGNAVYEYELAGGYRTIIPRDAIALDLGDITVSPGGNRLLSAPILGNLQVVDLESGVVSGFQRAPQVTEFGGRCGGASGKLAAWLDDQTFAWHESYAQKGYNGITIGSLATGERTLVPFFTVQDIRRVSATMLSFTTWEYLEGTGTNVSFPLTWVLDIETGEAKPVTVGSSPAWLADTAGSPNVSPWAWGGV